MAGMNRAPVQTRALASLLGALEPETLQRLQERFPDQRGLFDPTYTLGVDDSVNAAREHALRALIEATMNAACLAIPEMVKTITARMKAARLFRLAGTTTAICATALIGAQTAGVLPKDWQLIWTALSLAGSLLVLWGESLEKPMIGGQRSHAELLSEVLIAEASIVDIRLRMLDVNSDEPAVLFENARRANDTAAKLRQVSVFGGISFRGT